MFDGKRSLGHLHPLVNTPFSEAMASPKTFLQPILENSISFLDSLRPLARQVQASGELFVVADNSKGFRLVFSEETIDNLKSQKWKIPDDAATGLKRAEVRDGAGRIRETAKFEAQQTKLASAAKSMVAVAHIVSSIDTQLQLEKINEKLDHITNFLEADRYGKLTGLYRSIQKALSLDEAGADDLKLCSRDLETLQAQYFRSAQELFRAIRHPADISPLRAIFWTQKSAERKLRKSIAKVMNDLRISEFCNQLNAAVHIELGQDNPLLLNQRSLTEGYQEISVLLIEKTTYLDKALAEDVRAKLALLAHADGPVECLAERNELALS